MNDIPRQPSPLDLKSLSPSLTDEPDASLDAFVDTHGGTLARLAREFYQTYEAKGALLIDFRSPDREAEDIKLFVPYGIAGLSYERASDLTALVSKHRVSVSEVQALQDEVSEYVPEHQLVVLKIDGYGHGVYSTFDFEPPQNAPPV